jgi:hypothetical protein
MRRSKEDGMCDALEPQVIQISAVASDETSVLTTARGVAYDGAAGIADAGVGDIAGAGAIGHEWRLLGLPGHRLARGQATGKDGEI